MLGLLLVVLSLTWHFTIVATFATAHTSPRFSDYATDNQNTSDAVQQVSSSQFWRRPELHQTYSAKNPTSERHRICVKYNEAGPDNIENVRQWFDSWLALQSGTYSPGHLQEYFDIPVEAFNCSGPANSPKGPSSCIVATDDYCFDGLGTKDDLTMAWEALNLIARYRVAQSVVEGIFVLGLIPPKGDEYGKGLSRDFASILHDFYNGAYGDSALPAREIFEVVASAFLFAPYGVSNSSTLYKATLSALQAAQTSALQCNFLEAMNSTNTDCLTKPGLGGLWAQFHRQKSSIDSQLDYRDVITDVSSLTIPLHPDGNKLIEAYKNYREYFQRAMFVLTQQQQNLFLHVQPYDIPPAPGKEDDFSAYWGVFCPAIVGSNAGQWCRNSPTNGTDSLAYYPVQITGNRNGTVKFDYAPWDMVWSYGWNGNTIMGQSHRCADLQSQGFDLTGAYPHIFSSIRDHKDALAFYDSLDFSNVDYTDCLWSIPTLEFTDGPHFSGWDKTEDTLLRIADVLGGQPGAEQETPRTQWKDASPRNEKVWEVVRESNYCPILSTAEQIAGPFVGYLFPILKNWFGWGENEHDDQLVADVYGTQRLVNPSSKAGEAIATLKDAVCSKQKKDSYTDIAKTIIDLAVNIAVFEFTGGGPWLIKLVVQSGAAAITQTLGDDFLLQPWLDNVLKQQFTLDGDAKEKVADYLIPLYHTNKVGDGAEGVERR
ncbi:hypothetical protein ACLMJK_001487 [Lecanora helva]